MAGSQQSKGLYRQVSDKGESSSNSLNDTTLSTHQSIKVSNVIEREDGGSYDLMHAERRPCRGAGRKYYNNYCLLVRRIMVFIYHGQAPRSHLSRAEHSFLCCHQGGKQGDQFTAAAVVCGLVRNLVQ